MLNGGKKREKDLEHEHADEKGAAPGYVSGDNARIDAENGDVGESGVGGEAPLELPAVRRLVVALVGKSGQL